MKKICVFCGASVPKDKDFMEVAQQVGEWIGKNNHELIYGGGSTGLMGVLARAVMKYHKSIYGVTTDAIASFEAPIEDLKTKVVKTIQERKRLMIEKADVFITLTGGIGTIDEISDVLVDQEIGAHSKKLILVNTKGYFNPFMEWLANIEKSGLISDQTRSRLNYVLVDTPEQAFKEV
ncbi:MAG: TIGR00730 family Rossman fold protein [Alphaproteobacteria bacterium]|nr:TIGR00730 family Rossman fold protein [Alphaproteobacteria bacterium]